MVKAGAPMYISIRGGFLPYSRARFARKLSMKSHHNVGGLPADLQFELVEPLRQLFKDEVRACGVELGTDKQRRDA